MKIKLLGMAALVFAVGCGETDECTQIKKLAHQYQNATLRFKESAAKSGPLEKRAKDAEAAAKKRLDELGIDDKDDDVFAKLKARAGKLSGGSVEKHQVPKDNGGDPTVAPGTETDFVIGWKQKSVEKAIAEVDAMMEGAPLLRLVSVSLEKKKDLWRLELGRAVVDRVEINPKPVPPPSLPEPETIKTQLGFCGASESRQEIQKYKAEMDGLRNSALRTTVLLPTLTSWEGVLRRGELAEILEGESRRLAKIFLDGAVKAKVPFKAVGVQSPEVILEVWGGPKERAKLEDALKAHAAEIKKPELGAKDVVRMLMINEQARKVRVKGGEGPAPPGVGTSTGAPTKKP